MTQILDRAAIEKLPAAKLRPPSAGRSHPLGTRIRPDGVNFSIYSRGASAVELLLFDYEDDWRSARVIPLDPATNLTYHYEDNTGSAMKSLVVDTHKYD